MKESLNDFIYCRMIKTGYLRVHPAWLNYTGMGLKFMGTGLTHGMLVQGDGAAKVLEAVFADVYLLQLGVLRRVGGGEPGVHLIAAKLHHLQTVLLAVGGVALGRISHMTLFTGWHGNRAINRTSSVLINNNVQGSGSHVGIFCSCMRRNVKLSINERKRKDTPPWWATGRLWQLQFIL